MLKRFYGSAITMKPAMFSQRTGWDLGESAFALLVAERRSRGDLADLTQSNPTHCGFAYPANLLEPLSSPEAAIYDPSPLGAVVAREAVQRYYRDHDAEVSLHHICLTTGTSEGYSFLFRLLCDPGDEVLVARPSYPLFDFIARLDGVALREFPLAFDATAGARSEAWSLDLHLLTEAIGPRTRALILVHPNNPTGNFLSSQEREALDALCASRGLALIVDEVFLDYIVEAGPQRTFADRSGQALTFVLSGISKVCALPQMKASWIVATGPDNIVREAMARMEVIADTFLSMNAPVQSALSSWLEARGSLQQQIRDRVQANLAQLDARLPGTSASRNAVRGGWTVVLRVAREVHGFPFAEAALAAGVLVQPGEFYGFAPGRCVLSLLTPGDVWRHGLGLLPVD